MGAARSHPGIQEKRREEKRRGRRKRERGRKVGGAAAGIGRGAKGCDKRIGTDQEGGGRRWSRGVPEKRFSRVKSMSTGYGTAQPRNENDARCTCRENGF